MAYGMVYIRSFRLGNYPMCGHTQCIYTVLANSTLDQIQNCTIPPSALTLCILECVVDGFSGRPTNFRQLLKDSFLLLALTGKHSCGWVLRQPTNFQQLLKPPSVCSSDAAVHCLHLQECTHVDGFSGNPANFQELLKHSNSTNFQQLLKHSLACLHSLECTVMGFSGGPLSS
jgi:hypothetical protein